MASIGQLRAPGEPWRRAFIRNLSVLRTDALLAQGVRFAISGAVVSVVYISLTTVLAEASHLRFQLALAIGWCTAVSVHFTLQRTFVWRHHEQEFALPFAHQVRRYLLVAFTQLAVTAAATTLLPSLLGLPTEVIYLATAVLITLLNFLVFRHRIFHAGGNAGVNDGGPA